MKLNVNEASISKKIINCTSESSLFSIKLVHFKFNLLATAGDGVDGFGRQGKFQSLS